MSKEINSIKIVHAEVIARKDGFDTLEDFLDWFSEDFTGKLIHWTDLKY
jgi:hypothetical protein